MKPRRADTPADLAYWAELNPVPTTFGAPEGMDDSVAPCPALITESSDASFPGHVVRVAWTLDEIELAQLARGGTLWLSTFGALVPHFLEVQPPPEERQEPTDA